MKENLLIVDDEAHTREGLELALEDEFEIFCASNTEEASQALKHEEFQVVLTDLRMPGDSGMKVIDLAIRHPSKPLCI
ncbi:MAG: response regulator, partial [Verrucomicrobia bacterium]|nr:response regulator [Verrucomicrobiota bacterium]